MTATAKLAPETTEAPAPARGFPGLPCPKCGEVDGVSLNLAELDTCHCTSCDEEFSLALIRDLVAAWAPVLAWVAMAPAVEE